VNGTAHNASTLETTFKAVFKMCVVCTTGKERLPCQCVPATTCVADCHKADTSP